MTERTVEERSQIVILGMHRSGTSLATSFFIKMGAFVGGVGELLPPRMDNPGGFWERRDAFQANKHVLRRSNCRWYRLASFDVDGITRRSDAIFSEEARAIVQRLNQHRPWVLKDPRMCVLYPLWESFLENPLCVVVYRHPLDVALSLRKRNRLPLPFSLALWELYAVSALNASRQAARLFVSFDELTDAPVETANRLYKEAVANKVTGLHEPGEQAVRDSIRDRMGNEPDEESLEHDQVTALQRELWEGLQTGRFREDRGTLKPSARALALLREYEQKDYQRSPLLAKLRFQRRRLVQRFSKKRGPSQS